MSCTTNLQNTQTPPCKHKISLWSGIFIGAMTGSTGDANEYADVSAVTKSGLQSRFTAASPLDRLYPVMNLKNTAPEFSDDKIQELSDGGILILQKGADKITFILPLAHPLFGDKIDNFDDIEIGVYGVDVDGNFIYQNDKNTLTKVQMIAVNTISARYKMATDSEANHVSVTISFKASANPNYRNAIMAAALDIDLLSSTDVYGMIDVNRGVTVTSTSEAALLTLLTEYGTPVTGLIITDFTVTDTSDDSSVTPASVTESSDGVYAFTFTTETGNTLNILPVKDRFDFHGGFDIAIV